jgi:hypothetical protein
VCVLPDEAGTDYSDRCAQAQAGYGARRALGTSEIAVLIADKSDVFRMARGGRGPLFNLSDLRTDVRMDHG